LMSLKHSGQLGFRTSFNTCVIVSSPQAMP
jgi:hypothetical protein